MNWPSDNLETDSLDSNTDRPDRSLFLKLANAVKAIIAARGNANGVAPLGSDSKVPNGNLRRGDRDGVAPLDSSGKVPNSNLPRDSANGVAPLGADKIVPISNLPRAAADALGVLRTASDNDVDAMTSANVALSPANISALKTRVGLVSAVEITSTTTGDGAHLLDVSMAATIESGVLRISLTLSRSSSSSSSSSSPSPEPNNDTPY